METVTESEAFVYSVSCGLAMQCRIYRAFLGMSGMLRLMPIRWQGVQSPTILHHI